VSTTAARQTLNGNGHHPGDEPINLLLRGLNCLGLDWRADPESEDGPWRARCPHCHSLAPEDTFPLTLTRAGVVRCHRGCDPERIKAALLGVVREHEAATLEPSIVTLEEFAAVDEPGAAALVGDASSVLIAEGSDVMLYGDGGAGKTTLSIDLAFHLAAGDDWLQMPITRPARALIIENEGPRPLLRKKLARKLAAWNGSSLDGRVRVFEHPWGQFSFAPAEWRTKLAEIVSEHEIDVLIAGPLTRIGMDSAGTLQEVVAFMGLVADMRQQCGRLLTVVLVHHENKGGAVSGAWEGSGDTLLHVQGAGNGHTVVFVQKARWASDRHGTTLKLAWTEGEGFRLEGDRDYLAEIVELLSDGQWRTAKQISAPVDEGGIGAGETAVKATLNQNPERFESRTGMDAKALGKPKNTVLWNVRSGSNAPDSPSAFSGGAEDGAALRPALKGAAPDERTPGGSGEGALEGSTQPTQTDPDAELERIAAKFPGLDDEDAAP
jgi:hypothetical protein